MSMPPEQHPGQAPLSLSELAKRRAENATESSATAQTEEPTTLAPPPVEGSWRPIAPQAAQGELAPHSPAPLGGSSGKWGTSSPQTRALKERLAELSGSRLVEALRQLLGQADDTLFKFVEQASGSPDPEFLNAFKALRQHRASVERSFRHSNEIAWGLVEDKSKDASLGGLGGLSLVDEDELEESLAESLAVANAERMMSSEAAALSRRLAIIDGLPETEAPSNPLSASQIAEAFKSAMKEVVDLPVSAKMIVFKLFDRHVLTMLPELLGEVNQAFVDAGVLPELRPVINKAKDEGSRLQVEGQPTQGQGPGSAQSGSGNGNGGVAGSSASPVGAAPGGVSSSPAGMPGFAGPFVPWEAVQSLLSAHRDPAPMIMGPDGVEIPAPAVPMKDLIAAIEHLNQSVERLDSMEPLAFKKALQEMLVSRQGKEHDHPETLGDHEDAIDMIDLLFDFVMRDSDLPNQIKTILVRLQMPFLRIAVLEPQVFAEPTHPARTLLNLLSDAGKTWSEATDKQGELKKMIEETVERVLSEFERGSALFQELAQEFSSRWEAIKEKANRLEKRAAEAAVGKDKLERAREASIKAIINNLSGCVLPDRLRMGLHRAWAHYLTMTALREGEQSSAFRRATSLLVQVASISRSVKGSNPATNASRKGEVELLLGDWTKGLVAAGLPANEVETWRTILADFCHDRLGVDVGPTTKITTAPTLMHEDLAASATKSAPPDEKVSQEALDVVEALKNGTWVHWPKEGMRAKLAWIGGFTGKLMFVDTRGNKAVETHKQVLAREIEQHMAVVLSDAPLVEQALENIERKLTESKPLL